MSDNSPYPDRTVTSSGGLPDDLATRTSIPSGSSDATRTSFPVVPPEAGDTFGNYELISEIARGGMGVVYRAKQKGLDRTVALKMILGQADEGLRARLLVEAKSAGALDHPNVVPIYDCGEVNGQMFFTMAYVDGPDLKKYAESRGKLPLPEAMKLFGQIVAGVAHAHGKGIIHRDLKPANVLINRDGRPQITDFGLAKQTDRNSEMTKTGQVMGTPAYMAPEQARGLKVGPPADVYALGGIMYYLLTGDPPFVGDTVTDILVKLVTEEPVPPRQHIPDLPAELEAVCLNCLAKNPEERYPDAQALAADLAPLLDRYLPSTLAEFGSTAGSGFSTAGRSSGTSGVRGPYGLQSTQIKNVNTAAPAGGKTWMVAAGVAVAVVAAVGVVAVALKGNGSAAVAVAPPTGTGGSTGPGTVPPVAVPDAKTGDANVSKTSVTPNAAPPVGNPPVTQPIAATIPFPARMGRQDIKFQFELLGSGTLGENGVSQFKDGDKLRFRVLAQEDCHLRVWSIDADGVVVQLFPSEHDPDDRLTGGVTREMPGGRNYKMTFRPSAGGKPERVRALVSTTPINKVEPDQHFEGFGVYASAAGRDRLGIDIRGIEVAAIEMKTRVADAELMYLVSR